MSLGVILYAVVGALTDSMVVIPTAVSILSEAFLIVKFADRKSDTDGATRKDGWRIFWAVVVGNLITNGLLVVYLVVDMSTFEVVHAAAARVVSRALANLRMSLPRRESLEIRSCQWAIRRRVSMAATLGSSWVCSRGATC